LIQESSNIRVLTDLWLIFKGWLSTEVLLIKPSPLGEPNNELKIRLIEKDLIT